MKLSKEEFVAKMMADQQKMLEEKKKEERVNREYECYMWDNYTKMSKRWAHYYRYKSGRR